MILANLMIAMLTGTFRDVVSKAEDEWRLQWARVILRRERRLPWAAAERLAFGTLVAGQRTWIVEETDASLLGGESGSEEGSEGGSSGSEEEDARRRGGRVGAAARDRRASCRDRV